MKCSYEGIQDGVEYKYLELGNEIWARDTAMGDTSMRIIN